MKVTAFPLSADFNAIVSEALKWTDFGQNTMYQIVSTCTLNTRHGQSVILSLQKADGSNCSAWACGMLTKELQQKHMAMVICVENE